MSNEDKLVAFGKLVNYGHAPYKDDEKNQSSFFVEMENDNGERLKYWGLRLEDALNKSQSKVGESISLIDKGNIFGTKQRSWQIEPYEATKNYENSIIKDAVIDKDNQKDQGELTEKSEDEKVIFKTDQLQKEIELPPSVQNNYVPMVKNSLLKDQHINFYDKNDNSIAFEFREKSLATSRSDDKTIKAMLDLATSKGWNSISLKGTEEFKQKAWLHASLKGIEVKGYKPTEKDLVELQAAQDNLAKNSIIGEKTKGNVKEIEKIPEPEKNSIEQIDKEKMVAVINTYRDEVPTEQPITRLSGKEALQVALDTYKEKLSEQEKIGIEAAVMVNHKIYENDPRKLDSSLHYLSNQIPKIANKEIEIPKQPETVLRQPEIDIQLSKQSDQDRAR